MKVLLLLENFVYKDKRAINELNYFKKADIDVIIIHPEEADKPKEDQFLGFKMLRVYSYSLHDIKQWQKRREFKSYLVENFDFDIIHCHNQLLFHIGKEIKKIRPEVKLIYESRELFHSWPLNSSSIKNKWLLIKIWLVRKYEIYRERKDVYLLDNLITVCDSLGEDLKSYFKLKNKPVIIRSLPVKMPSIDRNNYLRQKYNLPPNNKILIFIGTNVYLKTLNIEQVIDEFGDKDHRTFVILANDNIHRKGVENYVIEKGYKNVFFHDSVKLDEMYKVIASADVGLVPTWNKKDLSYWYALDNKLFDYLFAGIPILATEQPEYKKIISKYKIGICVNPENENAYFNGFEEIIIKDFSGVLSEAPKELNWEIEELKLHELYQYYSN